MSANQKDTDLGRRHALRRLAMLAAATPGLRHFWPTRQFLQRRPRVATVPHRKPASDIKNTPKTHISAAIVRTSARAPALRPWVHARW